VSFDRPVNRLRQLFSFEVARMSLEESRWFDDEESVVELRAGTELGRFGLRATENSLSRLFTRRY
jgi:hypothetical protein